MKKRIHDALLSIVGLAGVAFFALSGASCEGPQMQCAVGHGAFILKYQVVSGDPVCYGSLKGEQAGFATYLTPVGRKEVKQKLDDGTEVTFVSADGADYNTRNFAAQSTTMHDLLAEREGTGAEADDKPFAYGVYTSNPDANNLCYPGGSAGASLGIAEINVPDFDTGKKDMMGNPIIIPAEHYRQEWKNLRFYVTEGVPGTQVRGEMRFEDVIKSCSVEFKFYGLYPAVPCGDDVFEQIDNDQDPSTPVENDKDDDKDPNTPVSNDKDDDKDPMTPVDNDDDDPNKPDVDADEPEYIRTDPNDIYCDPKGDPATGRLGSGINPDFTPVCDTEIFYCVPKAGTELIPDR